MSTHKPVSLEPRQWADALLGLSHLCADDIPAATRDRARQLNALLQLAPVPTRVEWPMPLSSARLEALLAIDAFETAVIAMLGHGCGYMLSSGSGGEALATVALPPARRELTCAGATPVLALIGALAMSLADIGAGKPATLRRARSEHGTALH